ncbi:MAG TPA: acyl carrier protein [Steroidobacteraceae bacterium]|nr:acyl carrier protein [Steroidobacteraceae bacterium]
MQQTIPKQADRTVDGIYAQLAQILELEELTAEVVLADCEYWDSLTVLSIIAMLDASFGVHLTASELRSMRSAGDLAAAVEQRRPR